MNMNIVIDSDVKNTENKIFNLSDVKNTENKKMSSHSDLVWFIKD